MKEWVGTCKKLKEVRGLVLKKLPRKGGIFSPAKTFSEVGHGRRVKF